jgi:glycosyltransferase involved in cell wall biosynthesis
MSTYGADTSLKIGLVAPPWLPVPPPSYGGTESVLDRLARGLGKAGHDVVLFGTDDSYVKGVSTVSSGAAASPEQIGNVVIEIGHVADAYEALSDCDVIHDHTIAGPMWALAVGRRRVTTTCHGPLSGRLADVYRAYSRRLPVIAISHDQARRAPDIKITRVIHHGVDPERFPAGAGDGGYLLFLGRMTEDKGPHRAIEVARAAGMPLKLAAKMREPTEREFFAAHVEPLLGGDICYLGEVGCEEKLELLANARALLNPIRWPEPFGLVMIQAMACGTPVIACPEGAAPEIVDHGTTGFLARDIPSLVEAVGQVDELDRQACRDAVAKRFSTARMVADHLELYEEMMSL